MNTLKDLTGQRFGHLVVVKRGEDKYSSSGRKRITWDCLCDCGKIKNNIDANNLKQGHVSSCGCMWRVNRSDFNYNIGEIINGYKIINHYRINGKKRYKYECLTCGQNNDVPEGRISCNHKCPVCSGRKIVEGINDLWTTHPHTAKLLKEPCEGNIYSKDSKQKVDWVCPRCKKIIRQKVISNVRRKGLKCPFCSDGISYPNKLMGNVLNQLVDYFETEYSPDWIKPKRYDFYIPSVNLIIEMDGGIGHGKSDIFGSVSIKESIKNDNYKQREANLRDINVIRIDSDYGKEDRFRYIKKNILSSELSNIFQLKKIDWNKVEIDSNSSKLFEFIKYIEDTPQNINKPITILCKEFNIPNTTGIRYVNNAIKQGICKYRKIPRTKDVNQYDLHGILLNTYISVQEASRLCGFGSSHIINCCNRKSYSAYGYQWRYKDDCDDIGILKNKNRDYSILYKKVVQFSLDGKLLKIFCSLKEAEEYIGVHHSSITRCCKGIQKTAGGYIWRYADENTENNIQDVVV